MNRDWMRQRLEAFQRLCEEYEAEGRRSHDYTERQRQLNDLMSFEYPAVKEILKRLDEKLVDEIAEPLYLSGAGKSLRATQQGLGILRDMDEWKRNLAPDAPSVVADDFHDWIWPPVATIWNTGQFRVAVQQAALSLSANIAIRTESSLTERKLVAQVFSPNPPPSEQVRLHFPGDSKSETWKSRQEGLHLLAQGAFAGIRNIATHANEVWTEQSALEQLAVLSVVARWAEQTDLVRG